ncbi:integrase core domain-containing protein [Chloroflexota bacterium]
MRDCSCGCERWRREYNQARTHRSLGYRTPVPETILTMATT